MDELVTLLENIMPGCDVEHCNDFVKEGYLTSFTMTQLVMALNDTFDIEITPVDLVPENFKNIDSIKALIERLED
jgi:acyl carrier protein